MTVVIGVRRRRAGDPDGLFHPVAAGDRPQQRQTEPCRRRGRQFGGLVRSDLRVTALRTTARRVRAWSSTTSTASPGTRLPRTTPTSSAVPSSAGVPTVRAMSPLPRRRSTHVRRAPSRQHRHRRFVRAHLDRSHHHDVHVTGPRHDGERVDGHGGGDDGGGDGRGRRSTVGGVEERGEQHASGRRSAGVQKRPSGRRASQPSPCPSSRVTRSTTAVNVSTHVPDSPRDLSETPLASCGT